MSDDLLTTWNWRRCEPHINFAYPFSLDGHLFHSNQIGEILSNTPDYYDPNSLEGKGQYNVECLSSYMACFQESYVVNTPLNRVQNTCTNRCGKYFGHSPEELNARLLAGQRLTLNGMDFDSVIGCHQEIDLVWI
jgi:hypothetical protein